MFDPVFHLEPMGRLANRMIAYMVALKFADMVRGCRISNISLPAWGIDHPCIESAGPVAVEQREQHIDLTMLADRMWAREITRVEWCGFGQRMENFLPRQRYRQIFVSPFSEPMGYGPEFLVCPVRAEDILDGPHPDYVLTPVEFYRDIVRMTGLKPVFIGQTQPNRYMDRIRQAFPDAIYREPRTDPLADFETIRQSRHAVIGVSTFSWLAAWLSDSLDTIFLTVSGLFNPMQSPAVDLLPFGDRRYRFFLFPINYAVPAVRHAEVHAGIAAYWQEIPHDTLQAGFATAPRYRRRLEDALAVFDEAFYLDTNADVAAVVRTLGPGAGLGHYINHGFHEGRMPLRFDRAWYCERYPFAAFQVASGDYASPADHYLAVGRGLGHYPCKPDAEC